MGHYGVGEVVVVRCGVLVLLEVPRLATVADGLGWRCVGNDSVVCTDFQSVEDTGDCPVSKYPILGIIMEVSGETK